MMISHNRFFLSGIKQEIKRTIAFARDEEIELKSFHATTFEDGDKQMLEKLSELKAIVIEYNVSKKAFYHLRQKELDRIRDMILFPKKYQKKLHVPSAIYTLDAAYTDTQSLLKTLNLLSAKSQALLANQSVIVRLANERQKVKAMEEKTIVEITKMENLKNNIDELNINLRKKTKTKQYQAELIKVEKQDNQLMKMMSVISNYVMKFHFDRFDGYTKSTYLAMAHQKLLDQFENKALSVTHYNIENVISAFKVFLVCCLQNKEPDGFFGSFFKSSKTQTGICILQHYKHELISILYRDRKATDRLNLDYANLANDLYQDEDIRKEAKETMIEANAKPPCEWRDPVSHKDNTNKAKVVELTIQEWARPRGR